MRPIICRLNLSVSAPPPWSFFFKRFFFLNFFWHKWTSIHCEEEENRRESLVVHYHIKHQAEIFAGHVTERQNSWGVSKNEMPRRVRRILFFGNMSLLCSFYRMVPTGYRRRIKKIKKNFCLWVFMFSINTLRARCSPCFESMFNYLCNLIDTYVHSPNKGPRPTL